MAVGPVTGPKGELKPLPCTIESARKPISIPREKNHPGPKWAKLEEITTVRSRKATVSKVRGRYRIAGAHLSHKSTSLNNGHLRTACHRERAPGQKRRYKKKWVRDRD